MIRTISLALPPTPSYPRRDLTAIVGGAWDDGRGATVWLAVSHAKKRRVGNRPTKEVLSRYAVSEVEEVGFMGRAFVWDKEWPENEHDEAERDDIPKPPYTVRLDVHGSIWCQCMGDKGGQAVSCRHCDSVLALMAEGAFDDGDEAPVF